MLNEVKRDELLIRIDERVTDIYRALAEGRSIMEDNKRRIGNLEAWRNRLVGATAVLGALGGFLLKIVFSKHIIS